ncbi:MAG: hypothetical protein SWX82_17945 [Cyanobacteriota bacterium]|nr:hypothetical protein [Cyanobacteriota bacterium]
MEKILRHQSREEKSYHPAKHLFFIEVATPKNFHPINSIDIIHVEAIAIFTFQSNYHPVKLQKRQGISSCIPEKIMIRFNHWESFAPTHDFLFN